MNLIYEFLIKLLSLCGSFSRKDSHYIFNAILFVTSCYSYYCKSDLTKK